MRSRTSTKRIAGKSAPPTCCRSNATAWKTSFPTSCPEGFDDVYELGDVVIAPDVAERQTHEFGTTFEQEISLLFVHGLLHLCGYDHIVEEEAQVMEALEDEILKAWNSR